MAISFARISFAHLLPDSGACRILAYNARCAVKDRRLDKTFDYSDQAGDLVEEFTIAPDGVVPPETVEDFANAIDAAEAKHVRRSLKNRKRRPQVGTVLIIALPPDTECTLDEAREIARRMVERARAGTNLVSRLALHDPALLSPGAQTRHAHGLTPKREWKGDHFGGPKVRELFARVRHRAVPKARLSFVAEGVDWPDLAWQLQQTLFAECAIDLVVDPIAPYSEPHWNPRVYGAAEARVIDRRELVTDLNVAAIRGDPEHLLNSLMRGRSSLLVAELERFIERYFDHDDDRRSRLDAILGHDKNVCLSPDDGGEARSVSTRTVHDQLIQAASLVDRAAKEEAPAIRAMTASDHDGVVTAIQDLLEASPLDSRRRTQRPLFLGVRRSDAEKTALASGLAHAKIATIGEVLDKKARSLRKVWHHLPAGGIVVLPRAEQVGDQLLARLLLACRDSRTALVLGHDQSRETGIVANRLAAYATERLAKIPAPVQGPFAGRADAAGLLLRSGLIGPALKAMEPVLRFAPAEADMCDADFLVCDDPRRLTEENERASHSGTDAAVIAVKARRANFELREGAWVVFTATDYSARPPRVRAGRMAKLALINRSTGEIHVALPDGTTERINLNSFPHVRPAFAISIREARQISWLCQLRILITTRRHAWAALLLACDATRSSFVVVDPKVASNPAELADVVRANLPGALPSELCTAPIPDAVHGLAPESTRHRADFVGLEIESIPECVSTVPPMVCDDDAAMANPEPELRTATISPPPRGRAAGSAREILHMETDRLTQLAGVDPRLRSSIASNHDALSGLVQLRRCLAADNPERQATADRLLRLCDVKGPTAAVIRSVMGRTQDAGAASDRAQDFPVDMEEQAPQGWIEWDLYRAKIDLAMMSYPSKWSIVRWPVPIPEPAPDDGLQWVPPQP